MNSYERVINTLQGIPADRVPVFAVLCAYGGKLTETNLRTLYSDAAVYVAGQRAVQQTFGFDLVLAPFDYGAIAEAFGGETAWFTDQAPNMKRPAVNSAAEALTVPMPDPQCTGRLPVILSAVRQLATIYKERVPLFVTIPGPCAFPALVIGLEEWINTLLFDETAAQKLLDYTGAFFVTWANALFAAGITGLVATESMASAEIAPRSLFKERLLPHLQAMFAQLQGPVIFHHGGGQLNHVLDLLPGLPGLAGVTISSKDDLAEARRLIGPDLLLIGNLDNLSFPTATAGEIYTKSLECLRIAAPAGRYILSHSAADIPLSTPPENLRAMIEASEIYAVGARSGL